MSGTSQLPPVGPLPGSERLLLSSLLWAPVAAIGEAANLLHADDLDEPYKSVYSAIVQCAREGVAGPQAVLDYLIRHGDASRSVRDELTAATIAGGVPESWKHHAAIVLAERFRARCESFGSAVIGWTATGSEAELWAGIRAGGAEIRKVAERLELARGGGL